MNDPGDIADHLELVDGEIHVWRASLNLSEALLERLYRTLSPDEQRQAGQFRFREHRDRFVAGHGILRDILARYLEVRPDRVGFGYASHGKPYLEEPRAGQDIRFNMSHSQMLGLFAITLGREVGIDVEQIREGFANDSIAEQFFAPREIRMLRSLPEHLQAEAFFTCWTRKEAYIKARGEGLSLPLDQFCVSLVPGEPAALLSTSQALDEDLAQAVRWSFCELSPYPGYAAALVVEREVSLSEQVRCWKWSAVL